MRAVEGAGRSEGWMRHSPPSSAETRRIVHPGGFAETPVLHGWRYLCCGYLDVSHRDLEAFMAGDMLPGMVFRSCEVLALDQLVDRILARLIARMLATQEGKETPDE